MSTELDFRTLPANVPVLCIPRVYPNINEARIRKIFDDLQLGLLDHIDIISKHNGKGENFNRVYVHFRRWNDNDNARIAREMLLKGKEIKIIYDEPWFWKISAYRETERKPAAPQSHRATIHIDYDNETHARRDTRPIAPCLDYRYQGQNQRPDSRPDRRRPDRRRPDRRPAELSHDKSSEFVPDFMKDEDQGLAIDYGNVTIRPKKRFLKKPALKFEEDQVEVNNLEEGEIQENV